MSQGAVGLGKKIEDTPKQVRGDADTGVFYAYQCVITFPLRAQRDFATFLGIFGGIVQQIGDDLLQPRRIAFQPLRFIRYGKNEMMSASLDQGQAVFYGLRDDLGQIAAFHF